MPGSARFINGYLMVDGPAGPPNFHLFGKDLLLVNHGADVGNVHLQSGPHGAGNHSIGATFAGELTLGAGYAQVDGARYQKIWYTGVLEFTGTATLADSMPSPVTLVRKFKMAGSLQGYLVNPFVDASTAVFDTNVSGEGVAIIELTSILDGPNRLFDLAKLTYHFFP